MTPVVSKRERLGSFSFKDNQLPKKKDGIYYDKFCEYKKGKSTCRSTAFENIRFVLENVFNKNKNTVVIIRDFRYKKLLNKRKYAKAFKYLHSLLGSVTAEKYAGKSPQNLLSIVLGVNSHELGVSSYRKGLV